MKLEHCKYQITVSVTVACARIPRGDEHQTVISIVKDINISETNMDRPNSQYGI